MKRIQAATMFLAAALLGGGALADTPRATGSGQTGVIKSIKAVSAPAKTTGGGAVLGAVAGGVLGHQIGNGRGNDVATVAGAVGGAFAGNAIEKSRSTTGRGYTIRVRLDDGRYRGFHQDSADELRIGDPVRIENDRIHLQRRAGK